jgi:hypothetical protein
MEENWGILLEKNVLYYGYDAPGGQPRALKKTNKQQAFSPEIGDTGSKMGRRLLSCCEFFCKGQKEHDGTSAAQ